MVVLAKEVQELAALGNNVETALNSTVDPLPQDERMIGTYRYDVAEGRKSVYDVHASLTAHCKVQGARMLVSLLLKFASGYELTAEVLVGAYKPSLPTFCHSQL